MEIFTTSSLYKISDNWRNQLQAGYTDLEMQIAFKDKDLFMASISGQDSDWASIEELKLEG
jgi:hypothetical protein